MSRTIENRIVQMQFDNKQFERGVAQSRETIKGLNDDLKLLEGVNALKNLDKNINSVNFSGITSGIETLQSRFSTLGVVGMSVTNTIASTITSNLIGAVETLKDKFSSLFDTIYEKGYNRAKNIQQATFSLEGLLSTSGMTAEQMAETTKKINEAIDNSVKGTAYGFDQAAKAASTLAATYGTDEQGIARIGKTLNTIVGVAAQTGTEFDRVAQIFETVAGNGRVMGDQLLSLGGMGLNARAEIARVLNSPEYRALKRELNAGLTTKKAKRSKDQEITQQDITDLVSRGLISADVFNAAFEGYFANAKRANETLEGITANIGAALGRLGAEFITPVIKNGGEYVQFLGVVRQKLVDVLDVIKKFNIPKEFEEGVDEFFSNLKENLDEVNVKDSDFYRRFDNLMQSISSALKIQNKETEFTDLLHQNLVDVLNNAENGFEHWEDVVELARKNLSQRLGTSSRFPFSHTIDEIHDLAELIAENNEETHNVYKSLDYYLDYARVQILGDEGYFSKNTTKTKEIQELAEQMYLAQMHRTTGPLTMKEAKALAALYINKNKSMEEYIEEARRTLRNQSGSHTINEIKELAAANRLQEIQQLAIQLSNEHNQYIVEESQLQYNNIREIEEVWSHDYMENIFSALGNFKTGIINIVAAVDTAIKGVLSPAEELYLVLTGEEVGGYQLRKIINEFSDSLLELSEKFKKFTAENETFKSIIKGIVGVFKILKTVGVIFIEVIKNAAVSFSPLISKIFNFLALVGDIVYGAAQLTDTGSAVSVVIDIISTIIDKIAKVLELLWDNGLPILQMIGKIIYALIAPALEMLRDKFFEAFNEFKETPVTEYLNLIYKWLTKIYNYVLENWPEFVQMVGPYVEILLKGLADLGSFILDVLSEAFDKALPYIRKFTDWLSELSGVAIDLTNPIKWLKDKLSDLSDETGNSSNVINTVTETLETVAPVVNDISDSLEKTADKIAKGARKASEFGDNINSKFSEPLSKAGQIVKDFKKDIFGVSDAVEDGGEKTERAMTPWQKVVAFVKGTLDIFGRMCKHIVDAYIRVKNWFKDIFSNNAGSNIGVMFDKYKEPFIKIRDWLKNADIEQIVALIGKIVSIIGNFKLKSGVANTFTGIGTFFKGLNNTLLNLNPIARQADNPTTRKLATSKIFDSIAKILLSIGAAMLMISASLYIISKIPRNDMERSKGMLIWMMGFIAVILGEVRMFGTVASAQAGGNLLVGNTFSTGSIGWKVIAALAAFIFLLGLAMLELTASLFIISKIVKSSTQDELTTALWIMAGMFVAIIAIIAVILGFSVKLSKQLDGGKGAAGVIAAMALLIWVISNAIIKILGALVIVSLIPMPHLWDSITVFGIVVAGIAALVGLIGFIAYKLSKSNMHNNKSAMYTLLAMAAIMFIIGSVITEIIGELAIIALIPKNYLGQAIGIFATVVVGLGILLAVVGSIAILMAKYSTKDSKSITANLIIIAAIIAIVGWVVSSIMGSLMELSLVLSIADKGMFRQLVEILVVIFGGIIAVVAISAALVGVMAALDKYAGLDMKKMTVALFAIAAIIACMGFVFISIGQLVKAIGESGLPINEVISLIGMTLGIILIITLIAGVLAGVAGMYEPVMYALWAVAAIFAAMALLFAGVGEFVKGIAIGVKLFAEAMSILTDTFERFANMPAEKVERAVNTLVVVIAGLANALVMGFIALGKALKANKEQVISTIVTILSFMLDAAMVWIPSLIQSALDTLGLIIEAISEWLLKHKAEIGVIIETLNEFFVQILENLIEMIWVIIKSNAEGLLDYLFGEDNQSGLAGRLLEIISKFIPILRETIVTTITNEIPNVTEAMALIIITLIASMANTIYEHQDEFCDAVHDLIDAALTLMLNLLGLGDASEENSPASYIKTFIKLMMGGWSLSDEDRKKIKNFVDSVVRWFRQKVRAAKQALENIATIFTSPFIDALKLVLGINSPSKVTEEIGEYTGEGFVEGVESKTGAAVKSGIQLAKAAATGIKEGTKSLNLDESINNALARNLRTSDIGQRTSLIGQLKDKLKNQVSALFSDFSFLDSFDFTITPDLDLTNIMSGMTDMESMLNTDEMNVDTSFSMDNAEEAAVGFDFSNGVLGDMKMEDIMPSDSSGTTINFTQNNYSPEELSRIDIYRDTKNMLNNPTLSSLF